MYLQNLKLLNFRNHKKSSLNFSLGINLITGKNSQGKTNLLEAISVLLIGRSHRTTLNDTLITLGEELSLVKGDLVGGSKKECVEAVFRLGETKIVKINGVRDQKTKDLRGLMNTILFSPEDLRIAKGGPDKRRAFIDEVGEQINYDYNHLRWKYLRTLKQRNDLLKLVAARNQKREALDLWDEKLVSTGSKFIYTRRDVVKKIRPYCERIFSKINPRGVFTIDYVNDFKDSEDVEVDFLKKIKSIREYEMGRGVTLVGPHRDDLELCVGGKDVRLYGSQGEQRMVGLCLKLGELELVQKERKRSPLLLMDDVLSELDEEKRGALLGFVSQLEQSIITSTSPDYFKCVSVGEINLIEISNGSIKEMGCLKA